MRDAHLQPIGCYAKERRDHSSLASQKPAAAAVHPDMASAWRRFQLLTRISAARSFATLPGRRHTAAVRLLALHALFLCNPPPEALGEFYAAEPDFVQDLVALLLAGNAVPEQLRTLVLRILAVQLIDRQRNGSVISAISSGGQSGLLSMLLHRAIASVAENDSQVLNSYSIFLKLIVPPALDTTLQAPRQHGSCRPKSSDISFHLRTASCTFLQCKAMDHRVGREKHEVVQSTRSWLGRAYAYHTITALQEGGFSMHFVEALLSLVGALSSSSSGCNALAEAGVVPALLPLIKDHNPKHVGLLGSAVRILEAFMDFSPPAATVFREIGGLSNMIDRLKLEVQAAPGAGGPPQEGEDSSLEGMQTDAAAGSSPAGAGTPTTGAVPVI